jgi:hypothetical protein
VRGVSIAAWTVFIIDAALVMLIVVLGIVASETVERDMMFGLAMLATVPLAALFAILGFSTMYRSRAGLWICLVLGVVPLILLLGMVVEQNFL